MAKQCIVYSSDGTRIDVEADSFELPHAHTLVLKRNFVGEDNKPKQQTVAIFFNPLAVILPDASSPAVASTTGDL
jgi:hypothetical protein